MVPPPRPCGVLTFLLVLSLSSPSRAETIESDRLAFTVDPATGVMTVTAKPAAKPFVTNVTFSGAIAGVKRAVVRDVTFGAGDSIEMTHPDGNRTRVSLFNGLPFALIRGTLHNSTPAPKVIDKTTVARVAVDVGASGSLKAMGTGGLSGIEQCPGSYAWLAVAEPATRRGVVAGWLTHDRASGVVLPKIDAGHLLLEARGEYGRLRIAPGAEAETETFAVGFFDDARLGLEAWADAVARVYRVKLPPQPLGYCTWYSDVHGGASGEKYVAQIADFAAKELKPYGFNFVQIDDGWQAGEKLNGPKKNFSAFNPHGPYPGGMKQTADGIKALGLTPGLWFMPFAGTFDDPFFKDHADWFVKGPDGKPFDTKWGGTCLDMTHPGARDYLRGVVKRIAGEWGFGYFKMDGLYTGTASRQVYVNAGYKDDHFGESVLHDPDKTHVEAYRDGLKLVREAAGDGVFILGAAAPQNMRSYAGAFGLVDAMRIGPDNGTKWASLTRGPLFGSRNYFLHGRLWYNDPDPLYVRQSVPLDHARLIATWVTVSGQLSASSDWLPALPPERLDLLRRTMPSHSLLPRPVDYFDRDLPRVWLLTDTRRPVRRDVVALYNWDDTPLTLEETSQRLGLDEATPYAAFDYWADALVPSFKGTLTATLPKQSCRVLAVRPVADHPQVISTSRHVTQGMVDLVEENWDAAQKTLGGRSKVVGGDAYELRVIVPAAWSVEGAELSADDAAGVTVSNKVEAGLARVVIRSATSREVSWAVRFKAAN